jgi:hypothetical protein
VLDNTFRFLIPEHPVMRPNAGFIDLVSPFSVFLGDPSSSFDPEGHNSDLGLFVRTSRAPLPEDVAIRKANRVVAERQKKRKDNKKKKAQRKQVRLDQKKRRQGSEEKEDEKEEEEEEEEGAYSSSSPTPWVDLADKEELAGGGASRGGPFPFHAEEDAPPESTGVGQSAPSEPCEKREDSKRPCADEAQPGSGGSAPKLLVRWHRGKLKKFLRSFVPIRYRRWLNVMPSTALADVGIPCRLCQGRPSPFSRDARGQPEPR